MAASLNRTLRTLHTHLSRMSTKISFLCEPFFCPLPDTGFCIDDDGAVFVLSACGENNREKERVKSQEIEWERPRLRDLGVSVVVNVWQLKGSTSPYRAREETNASLGLDYCFCTPVPSGVVAHNFPPPLAKTRTWLVLKKTSCRRNFKTKTKTTARSMLPARPKEPARPTETSTG